MKKLFVAALMVLGVSVLPSLAQIPPNPPVTRILLEGNCPGEEASGELICGVMQHGKLIGEWTIACPTPDKPANLILRPEKGERLAEGEATLYLCQNRDDLKSWYPSYGDAWQSLPIVLKRGLVEVAVPEDGWKTRVLSDPANLLTVHYHRFEGDYPSVGIWTWDRGLKKMPAQQEIYPVGRDDYGLIFQLDTADYGHAGSEIGLLPRMMGSWNHKDGGDRYWKPSLGNEVYMVEGSTNVTLKRPDVSPKLTGATLDSDNRITVRFTHMVEPLRPENITVRDSAGVTIPVADVKAFRKTPTGKCRSHVIKLDKKLEPEQFHGLQILLQGFPSRQVLLGRVLTDSRFYDPDARMGTIYTEKATTFRVFSPMAEQVEVALADQAKGGSILGLYPMERNEHGVWSTTIEGDHAGKFFAYKLRGPGLDPNRGVTDINAVCAQGPDGRGMIVDLDKTNPVGFGPSDYVSLEAPTDAVIYEMHVRDYTIDPKSGVKHKGKFLGWTEEGTRLQGEPDIRTGLDHLVELGVTHVQIMPIQDFGNSSESEDEGYNWGYMTAFFNTPEGWFATTPKGDARIREFKKLVQALHERGIGVILDVVYNHTASQSTFDALAPQYYYRIKPDGSYWNGSGCGNEFASDNPMARKFIVDSLKFWVTEYGVDGFRFDLMGLIDMKTLEQVRDELRKINPSVILYGEPWAAGPSGLKHLSTKEVVRGSGIGAFNDSFRDGIKGDRNDGPPGFVQAGAHVDRIKNGIRASIHEWSQEPTDAITYCAAHDNLTLWDKLIQTNPKLDDETRKRMQRFAGFLVLTSQGVPFLHGGQEMCRTKGGHHNSYEAPDSVNMIRWDWKKDHADVFDYYKALIEYRKEHPVLRIRTRDEVDERFEFLPVPSEKCVAYSLDGRDLPGEKYATTIILLNGDTSEQTFELPAGRWLISVNADEAEPVEAIDEATGSVTLPAHSGMLLHK